MDSVTSATATATATANSVNASGQQMISSDFETFLQMLSTQLRNQDPLNPVESADFAVQLATFSSVEQQVLTNNLLESLTGQMVSSSMSDLASWVGMEARSANAASWQGEAISVSANVADGADSAILVVRNAAGNPVFEGQVALDSDTLDWPGIDSNGATLPHGRYSFEMQSYAEGELIASEALESYAPITEARISNGEVLLVTASGELIASSDVTGLRLPPG